VASVTAELIIEASANTDEAQRDLSALNDRVDLVSNALGVFTAGAIAAGTALVIFAAQAAEEQQQIDRLAFALDAAGVQAERGMARLDAFMLTTARATGYTDDALRESLTLFTTYAAELRPALGDIEASGQLIADIARQTGKSLPEVAKAVSNVFAGQVAALGELSPGLRGFATDLMEVESATIRGDRAMSALRAQFDGAANSSGGAGVNMRVLGNEIDALGESVGNAVLRSGEFSGALDTLLIAVRDVDAEINDPSSGLSQSVENLGYVFGAAADATAYVTMSLSSFYNVLVDATEAGLAFGSVLTSIVTPFEGLIGAGDELGTTADAMGRLADSTSEWLGDTALGRLVGFEQRTRDLADTVVGAGEAWQFVTDAQERALSMGARLIPEVEARAASLYEQLRAFAFDGFEEPTRTSRGPAAPENDEAAKVKESITAVAELQRAADAAELEAAQQKAAALLEIQKEAETARLGQAAAAEQMRVQAAKDAGAAVVAAELADAEKRAAIERDLAMKRAQIAGASAQVVVGALDIILAGEQKSGRERRKELGTYIAAQGRGYLLQAIPEAFLNPARAAALAVGGAGMVALGASLGGRVFGGGGGGGAGGGSSTPGGTGLNVPTTPITRAGPTVVNDFAGSVIVANDPDTMRGLARRTDSARESGLGGGL
jgi:hypothetical protein